MSVKSISSFFVRVHTSTIFVNLGRTARGDARTMSSSWKKHACMWAWRGGLAKGLGSISDTEPTMHCISLVLLWTSSIKWATRLAARIRGNFPHFFLPFFLFFIFLYFFLIFHVFSFPLCPCSSYSSFPFYYYFIQILVMEVQHWLWAGFWNQMAWVWIRALLLFFLWNLLKVLSFLHH